MSNLFSSVNAGGARTWNGMKTNVSSEHPAVDLFYNIGSARGKFDTVAPLLAGAIANDKELAVRILLWARDARGGAGERQLFRDAIQYMADNSLLNLNEALNIMLKIPELGRWDDLLAFVGTDLEEDALKYWGDAAMNGNGLAAKWAPRKGPVANKMRKILGMSPKQFRKMLVGNTNVVETAMCSGNWSDINFSHVPSVAAARYQKSFARNAGTAYEIYKAELVKPENERDPSVKINAKAVYPYDIVKSVRKGDSVVANEQWKALPDYMEGSEFSGILPLVDVSASMTWGGGIGMGSIRPMDVAISLGLYVSERNRGIFKDEFITFHCNPQMIKTEGSLNERVLQMERSPWGGSTNVIGAFELIVNAAVKSNLPPEDMPKTLLILSDMQFNYCASYDDSAMEAITRRFNSAGYERPNVVFWNLNSSGDGTPSIYDKHGTALISGFSPSIMASVLKAENFTPEAIMRQSVEDSRYNWLPVK